MFYLQCTLLAFSLLIIYISLKWYNFPFVSKEEEKMDDSVLHQQWVKKQNLIRFALILVGIIINAFQYFVWDYVGAAYLGIMLLLAIPFVFAKRHK